MIEPEVPLAKQPYARPPITESVIGIKFAMRSDRELLDSASKRFSTWYPGEQVTPNLELRLDVDGFAPAAQIEQVVPSFRRASLDQQEILLLTSAEFIVSQLAPYPGWDTFFGRFERDWGHWKKIFGYRKIDRVAVRFINRIDLPAANAELIEFEEFLNVRPFLPDSFGPTLSFAIQAVFPLASIGCKLLINSAVILPPPIPDFMSFLLDLDIGRETDVPQRDDEMLMLLQRIREENNSVFEACITDKARELFHWQG